MPPAKYFTRLVQWLEAKEMNVFVPRSCRACVRSIKIEEKNIPKILEELYKTKIIIIIENYLRAKNNCICIPCCIDDCLDIQLKQ